MWVILPDDGLLSSDGTSQSTEEGLFNDWGRFFNDLEKLEPLGYLVANTAMQEKKIWSCKAKIMAKPGM